MTQTLDVGRFVEDLRRESDGPGTVVAHHVQPPKDADLAPYPDWVLPELREALESRGILSLYSHQRRAADALHAGKDIVVATPTLTVTIFAQSETSDSIASSSTAHRSRSATRIAIGCDVSASTTQNSSPP